MKLSKYALDFHDLDIKQIFLELTPKISNRLNDKGSNRVIYIQLSGQKLFDSVELEPYMDDKNTPEYEKITNLLWAVNKRGAAFVQKFMTFLCNLEDLVVISQDMREIIGDMVPISSVGPPVRKRSICADVQITENEYTIHENAAVSCMHVVKQNINSASAKPVKRMTRRHSVSTYSANSESKESCQVPQEINCDLVNSLEIPSIAVPLKKKTRRKSVNTYTENDENDENMLPQVLPHRKTSNSKAGEIKSQPRRRRRTVSESAVTTFLTDYPAMQNSENITVSRAITPPLSDQLMTTVNDQQTSTADDKMIQTACYQQTPTADDQPMLIVDNQSNVSTNYQATPSIDDQLKPTADVQQTPTIDDQKSAFTVDQQTSTVNNQRSTFSDDRTIPFADDQQTPTIDGRKATVADDLQTSTVDDQKTPFLVDKQMPTGEEMTPCCYDQSMEYSHDLKAAGIIDEKDSSTTMISDEKKPLMSEISSSHATSSLSPEPHKPTTILMSNGQNVVKERNFAKRVSKFVNIKNVFYFTLALCLGTLLVFSIVALVNRNDGRNSTLESSVRNITPIIIKSKSTEPTLFNENISSPDNSGVKKLRKTVVKKNDRFYSHNFSLGPIEYQQTVQKNDSNP